MTTVRFVVLLLLAASLAGCPASVGRETLGQDNGDNGSAGDTGGQGAPAECFQASDCVAEGPRCCDCPTHAVPKTDPAALACADVGCAPASCGSPMVAACEQGQCTLVCAPVACDASTSCPSGFATDENGCLTCQCAAPASLAQCTADGDCVRVRNDCCGCANGGSDTAVPTGEAASHDAALMCPAQPTCTGVDTCSPDLAARCVQGSCQLVDGTLPAGACGRADQAACPEGESCYVNADPQATMYGVGVCQP